MLKYHWPLAAVLVGCSGSSSSGVTDTRAGSTPAADTTTGGADTAGGSSGDDASGGSGGEVGADPIPYEGSFAGDGPGFRLASLTVDGAAREVGLYVPEGLPANPPLVIALHGTSGNPSDFMSELGLAGFAEENQVLLALPQAIERNGGSGEFGDPDHYGGAEASWGTSWNLADDSAETNNDLRLLRAIIQELRGSWGVDADRVYLFGHSNGAFFAYHAAAALSDRVAGFAENAGGAVRCENKGPDEAQFTGTGTSCDALAAEAGFPTCDGPIQSIAPDANGRVPWGFLAHHNDDSVVSVAWTCTLAAAMGDRAEEFIKAPDGDSFGHSVVTNFTSRAWAFLSGHTRRD